jgi:hypothetical protein
MRGLLELNSTAINGLHAMKTFDLNIDKILENWETAHAIREVIANAIDEATITGTAEPTITKDDEGWWHIRDFGRGFRHEHLLQKENPEKLTNPHVIGKFGIGLKDALATFERKGVMVWLRSRYEDITLARTTKHSFEDLVTLHAAVVPPSFPDLEGTECCLFGVTDSDIRAAESMFLRFGDAKEIAVTKYGSVYSASAEGGVIYINGMRVGIEPNFLFSYDITALNASLKRALNRERQNLGRSTYSDRIRAILLACDSEQVAQALTSDLEKYSQGTAHDELAWLDVQEHAVRILNASRPSVFLTHDQMINARDMVDEVQRSGFQIVAVPESLGRRIGGLKDIAGQPVKGLEQFVSERAASFEFKWVSPEELSPQEQFVWAKMNQIFELVGGRPSVVREVRVSETTCSEACVGSETVGLWVVAEGRIVIKRTQLRSLESFAGTLLHEYLHARYGVSDVSREFEQVLTSVIGLLVTRALTPKPAGQQVQPTDRENLVNRCIEIFRSEQKASVSLLVRRLKLGFTEAASLMDELEVRGIVGPSKGAEPRDVFV